MELDQATAAIIAASIAALASIANLFFNIFNQIMLENRSAYRKTLERHYNTLGELLHQSVAISDVIAKRISLSQGIESWTNKNSKVKKKLEYCRKQVRYSLWGVDDGLRRMTRVSNWVTHCKCIPDRVYEIVVTADKLRKCLDRIIMNSYKKGRRPTLLDRLKVKYRVWRLEKKYHEIKSVQPAS
jgi:hypothetical protein